jgi:cytidylate kinase
MVSISLPEETRRLRLQVAIDGPAGAGKSAVGRELARELKCAYLDTGLMYRAVTWLALQKGIPETDGKALGRLAAQTEFESDPCVLDALVVGGETLREELQDPRVDAAVSRVSAYPSVREALVDKQRAFAEDRCIVMVGRDIGTTVLPGAQIKLWITASMEERARRRMRDRSDGKDLTEMVASIRHRDHLDTARTASPLRRADDAIVLDTDNLDEGASIGRAREIVAWRTAELSHAGQASSAN